VQLNDGALIKTEKGRHVLGSDALCREEKRSGGDA
jgi:hypothetical protein